MLKSSSTVCPFSNISIWDMSLLHLSGALMQFVPTQRPNCVFEPSCRGCKCLEILSMFILMSTPAAPCMCPAVSCDFGQQSMIKAQRLKHQTVTLDTKWTFLLNRSFSLRRYYKKNSTSTAMSQCKHWWIYSITHAVSSESPKDDLAHRLTNQWRSRGKEGKLLKRLKFYRLRERSLC